VTAYFLLPAAGGSGWVIAGRLAASLVALAVVAIVGVRVVATSDRPGQRALEALVAIVVFAILVFAWTYAFMSSGNEASFSEPLSHTSALYFSMTTSATVGFGDISARTDAARIVVMVHMLVNFALVGSAVRLLAHTAQRRMQSQ
jgi:hypothetical protein